MKYKCAQCLQEIPDGSVPFTIEESITIIAAGLRRPQKIKRIKKICSPTCINAFLDKWIKETQS